jgi:glycosyltransferase involved in cell wall biosynthesis
MGFEILALSDDWDGLPTSCRHLLRQFLPEVPLTWVETIGLRSPRLRLYDVRRSFQKLRGWMAPRPRPVPLPENLEVVDALQVPWNALGLVRRLNRALLLRALRRRASPAGSARRVVITTWPFLGDLIGRLGEELSIYYRVDDFSRFPGVRTEAIRTLERRLIERVDLVVASAENLLPAGAPGKEARYLPHGVDYDHFARPRESRGEERVRGLPGPRIGFFGIIDEWIDLELVGAVARARPDWSLVLLGPSQVPTTALERFPNVHLLGPVPYGDLPGHARHFDAAIIPFRLNELTRCVNPLKLLEYFSLGLPVISTPLPEVLRHGPLASTASSPGEFVEAIAVALYEDGPARRAQRRAAAEAQSWRSRSRVLRDWIETALEGKFARAG